MIKWVAFISSWFGKSGLKAKIIWPSSHLGRGFRAELRNCCRSQNEITRVVSFFWKVATILVDLLTIELKLHLSHVKLMLSQPMYLAHELILSIQITRRVDINGDSQQWKVIAGTEFRICKLPTQVLIVWVTKLKSKKTFFTMY